MPELRKQYCSLEELLSRDKSSFEQQAKAQGVTETQLQEITNVLRNIERNKNAVPALDEYTRVRIGKLTVPKGFLRHVELLAKFASVSEEAIWQLLMIETCAMYAGRYSKLVDVLNETIKGGNSE